MNTKNDTAILKTENYLGPDLKKKKKILETGNTLCNCNRPNCSLVCCLF